MNVVDSLFSASESLMLRLSSGLKGSMFDYCRFETLAREGRKVDAYTLTTNSGDLVSLVRVPGALSLIGQTEFVEMTHALELLYNQLLENGYHDIQWVFQRTPEETENALEALNAPMLQTAQRLNVNMDVMRSIARERVEVLGRYTVAESTYLAVVTRMRALSKAAIKQVGRELDKQSKRYKLNPKPDFFGQPVLSESSTLLMQHRSAVRGVLKALRSSRTPMVVEPLDAHQFLSIVRRMVDPDGTSRVWRPVLPGDKPSVQAKTLGGKAEGMKLTYPLIGTQVFRRRAEPVENMPNITRYGDRFFGTALMDLTPQEPRSFSALFRSIPAEVDWMLSYTVRGGKGIKRTIQAKKTLSKFLRYFGDNEAIYESARTLLEEIGGAGGETTLQIRCAISVRGKSPEIVRDHLNLVTRAMQDWGNADVDEEVGDPVAGFISCLPGLDGGNIGQKLIWPAREAAYISPIGRPSSPWAKGSLIYRTQDGQIYPMQPGSSIQEGVFEIFVAPPRSGKSVQLNTISLAISFDAGASRLPRILSLDIGGSSLGYVDFLREILPEDRKDEAVAFKMKNTREFAINPFDTQLGVFEPTSSERGFLVNFLTLLFTPIGAENAPAGTAEVVGTLISEAYREVVERKPKKYQEHIAPEVDEILVAYPEWFAPDEVKTWKAVTEKLMGIGKYHLAGIAQRYAVPTLRDLPSVISKSEAIKSIFSGKTVEGGGTLLEHMNMMISSTLSEYPVLAYPTAFDPSAARVISIDLAEVAASGGAAQRKQAGLMYMLCRHLARDYFFDEEDAATFPSPAREYHTARLRASRGEVKRINYDEYHRTKGLAAVRTQIEQDVREGPKKRVHIGLSSQDLGDFDAEMVSMATNLYIMKAPDEYVIRKLHEQFGLPDSAIDALRSEVRGAGPDGASFLLRTITSKGTFYQSLVNTRGPMELWIQSSTGEDVMLRQMLTQRVGFLGAIQRLARHFPGGSMRKALEEWQERFPDKETSDYIRQLTDELAKK